MGLDTFRRLEDQVLRLLREREELKAENAGLKAVLESMERETKELKAKLADLSSERTAVREKVDSLIERIDAIMTGQGAAH